MHVCQGGVQEATRAAEKLCQDLPSDPFGFRWSHKLFWCFGVSGLRCCLNLINFQYISICSAAKTPSSGEDGCYRCCHQNAGRSGLESWTSLASMSCSLCSDGKPPTSSLDQMMSIHAPHFIPGVESWKWMSWYWLVLCQSFSRIVCMAFHLRWLASCDPWPGYGLGPPAAEAECCGRAQRPSDWQRASVSTSKTCAPACNWPQSNSAFWTKVTSQQTTSLDQQTCTLPKFANVLGHAFREARAGDKSVL